MCGLFPWLQQWQFPWRKRVHNSVVPRLPKNVPAPFKLRNLCNPIRSRLRSKKIVNGENRGGKPGTDGTFPIFRPNVGTKPIRTIQNYPEVTANPPDTARFYAVGSRILTPGTSTASGFFRHYLL
jgi:hypothetical protein